MVSSPLSQRRMDLPPALGAAVVAAALVAAPVVAGAEVVAPLLLSSSDEPQAA